MRKRRTRGFLLVVVWSLLLSTSGCATLRRQASTPDLQPSGDGFAETADGWRLGIRRYRPTVPDRGKLPVVLCHGLGLNATFWTITDRHLPRQLADRGYEVFVVDLRGSGSSHKIGAVGQINQVLRETPLLEIGESRWTMDDQARFDVPAVLDYVENATGSRRVNWVGHSLGGMLMLAHLETTKEPERIANFVDMGGVAYLAGSAVQTKMLRANRGLRVLLSVISTGRLARPMTYRFFRPPGLDKVDQFYYTSSNVEEETVSRFYGYTLENPGKGALKQLDPYLERGRLYSADGRIDYAERLGEIRTPILMIAGEHDVMADIPSTLLTFDALGSPDKTLKRFGKKHGHVGDYGHCDLVWSRHAPAEIFPPLIDWLDDRQPRGPVEQTGVSLSPPRSF